MARNDNGLDHPRRRSPAFFALCALALMALAATPFSAQSPAQPLLDGGYPYDWSHHHVVYSAAANLAELAKVQDQPRYWHEWFRRNAALIRGAQPFAARPVPQPSPARRDSSDEGIWGESLAAGGTVGAGNFPAKYSFSTTATPTCTDYVAFNTSLPGSGSYAIVFNNTNDTTTTHSITIKNNSTGLTLTLSPNTSNANTGTGTGTWINDATSGATIDYSSNANNFFLALNTAGNGSYVGVYAASVTGTETTATVTIAATQLGPVSITVDNVSVTNITTPASGNSANLSSPVNDAGSATATFTATTATGTFKITNALTGATLTLTAGTSNSGTTWANNSGSANTNASNFNTILNANGSTVGVYSTVSSATVTITASLLGSYSVSFTNTGVSNLTASSWTSGTNAVRVLAYKDLYATTCSGAPTLSWQYETGGEIRTSVALSGTGSQLAFVQSYDASSTTTAAQLVLLKPGTTSTLVIPTVVAAGSYRGCTAPCMTTFPLNHDDTGSSPFVDYVNDAIYVGDNAGVLYKFTGVFVGTPAAAGGSFPVTVSANKLTSPVLYVSGSTSDLLVADSGGFLYSYSTAGALNGHSGQLTPTASLGIVDAPLVDTIAGTVYVWAGEDNTVVTGAYCDNSPYGCDGVFQFTISTLSASSGAGACAETTTNTTSWSTGTNCGSESVYGNGSPGNVLYAGTFDNTHWSSGGTNGNLWSCSTVGPGGSAGQGNDSFSKIVSSVLTTSGFDGGAIISTNAIIYISNAAGSCSPTTEIYNGSTDYIYVGVTAGGKLTTSPATTCTTGCVYSFTLSGATATTSHGLAASGGSSALIIDNTGTGTGESQVYFSYLSGATSSVTCPAPSGASSGGCVVQASQAGLQ